MKRPLIVALAGLALCAARGVVHGQGPRTIDFQRDVQPVLREHCYSCHGPEQQMNGFRLDRRADALRGGTQTVIGPGNADGSRFYHRLVDTTVGMRMPPTGPLVPDQIRILKAWIDEGAVWPDELAGDRPLPPVDADAERLAHLIREGNRTAANDQLRARPNVVRSRTSGGSTPLMFAALYGDADLVRTLLASGADPNVADAAGATALMWAVPDVARMTALLDAGADVNALSDDRRSPLVVAAGIVRSTPAATLLLDYGADPSPRLASDPSALREAARVDNVEVFRSLMAYGADPRTVPAALLRSNCFGCALAANVGGTGPLAKSEPDDSGLRPTLAPERLAPAVVLDRVNREATRAAVERALPPLQRLGPAFIQKTGCVSCHHNSLVSMAVTAAAAAGYRVDQSAVDRQRELTAAYLNSWRSRTLQNRTVAGGQDSDSYLLFGLAADRHSADLGTDAQAIWLLRRQASDGRWPVTTLRPPIESNDIAVTAISLRAVDVYAPPAMRESAVEAIARAGQWLRTAIAQSTEERALKVMGLAWANAAPNDLATARRELVGSQRADGGWAQHNSGASDAYATGEAVVALEPSADPVHRAAVQRGIEFLLRSQLTDGSWVVISHAVPIQSYFESGFPHGADQWISAAASAWAVTALASYR